MYIYGWGQLTGHKPGGKPRFTSITWSGIVSRVGQGHLRFYTEETLSSIISVVNRATMECDLILTQGFTDSHILLSHLKVGVVVMSDASSGGFGPII